VLKGRHVTPRIAPYGTWQSPIAADVVARQSGRPGWVGVVGDEVWWTHARPTEGGRVELLRQSADGNVSAVLPAPWNVRTRVIEYGGKAWCAAAGESPVVVFAHWDDQRLYRSTVDSSGPAPLTPLPERPAGLRYVDPVIVGDEVWCVREVHHSMEPTDVTRQLVAVPMSGAAASDAAAVRVLAASHHFVTGPRIAPGGRRVAWLGWNHPDMPWDATELCVAEVRSDGTLGAHRVVAGGPDESIVQVEWLDDDTLVFVGDTTGWWNPYRIRHDGTDRENLLPGEEEFGGAIWQLGTRWLAPLADGRIAMVHGRAATTLSIVDPRLGTLAATPGPYTEWAPTLAASGTTLVAVGAAAKVPYEVVRIDTRDHTVEAVSVDHRHLDLPDPAWLPEHEFVTCEGAGGRDIHAQVYAPTNPGFAAPDGELPPYLVFVHGGPTSRAVAVYDLEIAYFTSRGIGVVEVNYGGSTGHGREYRNRLRDNWGLVDVEDCATVARALAANGIADPERIAIRGGSAGGWTAGASLTGTAPGADIYRCGAIYYPILDLAGWRTGETHDFESRYLDGLVGPWPETEERYRERSPVNRADRLDRPFLLLQGTEDQICPPVQSERLLARVAGRGVPHAYLTFDGEQHGFRRHATIVASIEAELSFYGQVLGFATPDVPKVELNA
jgi:dipeptidyl aminopeptidase/acylaminoacyl peptidase